MNLAMSLPEVWDKVWPFLVAVLFFEVIIIVHEFGHFFFAKLNGIKVEEFAIGMGPKIISFTRCSTKYSLRLFLIGGYCAMEGEDEEVSSETSFSSKKVWQRMLVVVAGAVFNLILGFIIAVVIVSSQNLVGTTIVAKFDDNASSVNYGLQAGDEIKSINGMRIYSSADISTGLARDDDGVVDMVVKRDGQKVDLKSVKFNTQKVEYGNISRNVIMMDFYILGKPKNVGNVIVEGFKETVAMGRTVFLSLHDLLVGKYSLSELSGPVGTVTIIAETATVSFSALLQIMLLLTVNIGLFNLFPIPALDGWRFFTLLFEAVTRKKPNKKVEYAINAAGFVFLMIVMVLVTFSDLTKIF